MVIELGKYATLRVVKELDFGVYLDGGPYGEILLPIKQVPEGTQPEDEIKVFIYLDSEDRIIATTIKPFATVGEFAFLEVQEISEYGAFLDWGLYSKHLFVPYREQVEPMREGRKYLVYLYVDEKTDRIVATTRFNKYLKNVSDTYKEGEAVDLVIAQRTPMGFRVAINNDTWGMLYQNEVFKPLRVGQKAKGFIKKVRPDGKIDLSLQQQGFKKVIDKNTVLILDKLKAENGFLPLTDKSAPELIYDVLGMSKKNFKKTIGGLYKLKLVTLKKDGVYLVSKKD